MAASIKVLVYWTTETKWSIVSESAVKGDVVPGNQTYTKYLGKLYPSIIVAKGHQNEIGKAEESLKEFLQDCMLEEDPDDLEAFQRCVLQYISENEANKQCLEVQRTTVQKTSGTVMLQKIRASKVCAAPEMQLRVSKDSAAPEKDQTPQDSTCKRVSTVCAAPEMQLGVLKDSAAPEKDLVIQTPQDSSRKRLAFVSEWISEDEENGENIESTSHTCGRVLEVSKACPAVPAKPDDNVVSKPKDSSQYVTLAQLDEILDGYARKSELRRLKRKFEETTNVTRNDVEDELDPLISRQKGHFEAVEAGLLKLFTVEEINNHSATGKKANSHTPAKPKLDPERFTLIAKLVEKHFKISHKEIVMKTQAVKRKLAKQMA